MDPLDEEPTQPTRSRSQMRRQKGKRRELAGAERTPRVKPKPPEPKDARARQSHCQVVRQGSLVRILQALSHHDRTDQGADARSGVYYGPPRKIERSELEHPTALRPDPMCDRIINQSRPQEY